MGMSKRKRSAVWIYFDVVGTDATRILCNNTVKTSGKTSNGLKYLKNKHHKEFQIVQEEQEETKCQKTDQVLMTQPKQATLELTIKRSQVYARESASCNKMMVASLRC